MVWSTHKMPANQARRTRSGHSSERAQQRNDSRSPMPRGMCRAPSMMTAGAEGTGTAGAEGEAGGTTAGTRADAVSVDMICLPGSLLQHGQAQLTAVDKGALFAAEPAVLGLLALPLVDLFHQCVDHLVLQDVADDLAALEDDALALAGGDAEVGLACLAWPVDDAAQDAHL